jgi:hypothetical protein
MSAISLIQILLWNVFVTVPIVAITCLLISGRKVRRPPTEAELKQQEAVDRLIRSLGEPRSGGHGP